MNLRELLDGIDRQLAAGDALRARAILDAVLAEPMRLADFAALSASLVRNDRQLESLGDPLRVAVLGGFTTQPIATLMPAVGLALGRRVAVYESGYNAYVQEALDPRSGASRFKPEVTLFATSSVNVAEWPKTGSPDAEVQVVVDREIDRLRRLWAAFQGGDRIVLQHSFEPVAGGDPAGRLAAKYGWSKTRYIEAINRRLWELDGAAGLRVLDFAALAARHGSWKFSDPRLYCHSKHAFHPGFTADYALSLLGVLRAAFGATKKVLVTDLDNTLWGGTVGDDGSEAIALGPDTAEGEAHLAYARYLLDMKARGIFIAVCSKNDEAVARTGFAKPGVPLRPEDFSAFVCNFEPKASNLRKIAARLNVGLDSLVFVDDDAVECAAVRELAPEVTAVQMNVDPSVFPRKLDRLGLFDALDLTSEDLLRSASTAGRAPPPAQASSEDLEKFLESLDMTGELREATAADAARVEQIFGKTNQFNLTTKKFSQQSIVEARSNGAIVLVGTLSDRYAPYGIVSALVAHPEGARLEVDNWVLSCRVFSRTFEEFLLGELGARAASMGLATVGGRIVETAKNVYAREWLAKRGLLQGERWSFVPATGPLSTNVRRAEGGGSR